MKKASFTFTLVFINIGYLEQVAASAVALNCVVKHAKYDSAFGGERETEKFSRRD